MTGLSRRTKLITGAIAAAVLVAAIALPFTSPIRVASRDRMTLAELYAGTESCLPCHRQIVQSFQGSPHSLALRSMKQISAADTYLPTASPVTRAGIDYEYLERDGRIFVRSPSYAGGQPIELEWCFGSGDYALTFLSFLRTSAGMTHGLEHRLSWWQRPGELDVTIGHPKDDPPPGLEAMGKLYPLHELRSCFGCHATVLPEDLDEISPETIVAGIQCERCHGPARAHVDAMRRRKTGTQIEDLSRLSSRQAIDRCGDCHRREDQIDPRVIVAGSTLIARFQPVGIAQSACYRKSQDHQPSMTCTTCHDPHGPRERDVAFYTSICTSCHDPKKAAADSVICRVAPTAEDCVTCHMPKAQVGTHMIVTDHWIRVLKR